VVTLHVVELYNNWSFSTLRRQRSDVSHNAALVVVVGSMAIVFTRPSVSV